MKTLTDLKPEIAHFLHPETGVERGLYPRKDPDEKVIGITCGELRRIGRLLRDLNHVI